MRPGNAEQEEGGGTPGFIRLIDSLRSLSILSAWFVTISVLVALYCLGGRECPGHQILVALSTSKRHREPVYGLPPLCSCFFKVAGGNLYEHRKKSNLCGIGRGHRQEAGVGVHQW